MPTTSFRSILYAIGVLAGFSFVGVATPSASAQDRDIALRAGLSVTSLSGEGDFDPLINLAGALSVRLHFGAIFLQTEAQVTTRGTSNAQQEPYPIIPGSNIIPYSRLRTDITYVDVPLFLGTQLQAGVKPAIYAGPYGGFRMNARDRFTNAITDLTTTLDSRDVKLLDYGVAAGVGLEIPSRFYHILIDLRATMGLAPVFDDAGDQHHRMLTLTAGFIL